MRPSEDGKLPLAPEFASGTETTYLGGSQYGHLGAHPNAIEVFTPAHMNRTRAHSLFGSTQTMPVCK